MKLPKNITVLTVGIINHARNSSADQIRTLDKATLNRTWEYWSILFWISFCLLCKNILYHFLRK